jgi:hypothetical protein
MDWVSRYVLTWQLSNLRDTSFCVAAVEEALGKGRPEIFNTDQGSQFTDDDFTGVLRDHQVAISMDGRGRFSDNILVERLWRSLKYEDVYLKAYASVAEARQAITAYLKFYNNERLYQALDYRTPRQVFEQALRPASSARGINARRAPTAGATMNRKPGQRSTLRTLDPGLIDRVHLRATRDRLYGANGMKARRSVFIKSTHRPAPERPQLFVEVGIQWPFSAVQFPPLPKTCPFYRPVFARYSKYRLGSILRIKRL